MPLLKKAGKALFSHLPCRVSLYHICKHYVDWYNGENDDDIRTNGELRFMGEMLRHSNTVFDVGANDGQWARSAVEINSAIHLHCFEPSPYTFKLLLQNHFPKNVICNNLGLGATTEEKTLFVFEDGSKLNSLYQRQGIEHFSLPKQNRKEVIHLTTVDVYSNENHIEQIDYLKLDVEGHELEVLKGASQFLRERRIKIIQFEYGGCNIDSRVFLRDIWNYILDINPDYAFYKIYPKGIKRIFNYRQAFDNFQYQNWVVIQNA